VGGRKRTKREPPLDLAPSRYGKKKGTAKEEIKNQKGLGENEIAGGGGKGN